MADLILEAPAHLDEVLLTLKELRRRLDVEMSSGLAASKGAGLNPTHVRAAMQLANASAQLSREVRAWTKRVRELAQSAPLEQRKAAVLRFLQELPPTERGEILEALDE